MQQAILSKERGLVKDRERVERSLSLPSRPQLAETAHTNKLAAASRIYLAASSVVMLLAFFMPLWDITLEAPQYPEGLGLEIWLNRIGGDLTIINGLNHYIGMQHIDPASFRELVYMPYILCGLAALGLFTVLLNRKYALVVFAVVVLALGVAGSIDFYMWEYNYGHNLDPHAAIIVPGMSYQPPMFGAKQLLNFRAIAWPGIGGWAIIVAGAGIVMITIYELLRNNSRHAR